MSNTTENYAHLTPVSHLMDNSQTAKNVRAELKKHFKGVKFSVRSTLHSITVKWTDAVKESDVVAVLNKFKTHEGKHSFSETYGYCNYLFTEREYSRAFVQKALDFIAGKYDCQGIEMTAERYEQGLCHEYPKGLEKLQSVEDLVRKQLRNQDAN